MNSSRYVATAVKIDTGRNKYSRVDLRESKACCSFAMDYTTKSCLALDNAIWNTHLATKGRQEQHDLHAFL